MPPERPDADREIELRYQYVEFLADHLADCSRVFGGDLQEMLVLAVMGQVLLRAQLDAGPDGRVTPRTMPGAVGITASRIADVTGIPRQTVRRKLMKLQDRGWVEQRDTGFWAVCLREGTALARQGEDGLGALDARAMHRVGRMAQAMAAIVTRTQRSR